MFTDSLSDEDSGLGLQLPTLDVDSLLLHVSPIDSVLQDALSNPDFLQLQPCDSDHSEEFVVDGCVQHQSSVRGTKRTREDELDCLMSVKRQCFTTKFTDCINSDILFFRNCC